MKLLKRIMAGSLALALVIGACVAFTGCKVKGGTYAFAGDVTVTVITKTEKDADGKYTITETKDLTLTEYYLYERQRVALDKLAETQIEDQADFDDWKKEFIAEYEAEMGNITLKFKGSKVEMISEHKDNATDRVKAKMIMEATYKKVEDNKYVMTMEEKEGNTTTITETEFFIDANDNVCIKYYETFASNTELGGERVVLAYNVVFSEVK